MKTTIYIVRHGEAEGNVKETFSDEDIKRWGELQGGLTPKGLDQAKTVAKRLAGIHFDAIFSSDFTRAHETANTIAEGRNIPVVTNTTIRERHYGDDFFKTTKEDREELKKALVNLNDEEKFLYKFYPDGESAKEAVDRFTTFLHEIIPLNAGKTICVVNHGAVMRAFLVHIGWAKYDELPGGSIKNTGYIVLETDGKTFTVKETYNINKQAIDNEA